MLNKKSKFSKIEQFEELKKYLKNKKYIDYNISFGKYKFTYKNYLVTDVRPENLFKLNFEYIIEQMKKYFPDIDYELEYEVPSIMEKKLIKNNKKYKHDVYIKLNYNDKMYDLSIEYDEKETHDKTLVKDDAKEIKSNFFTDKYLAYSENNDIELFIKDAIYNILLYSCAIIDDIYNLVRINFFKLNEYSIDLEEALDEIIELFKNKTTDFHRWANKLLIKNKHTKKLLTTDELIEYLDEKYDVQPVFTTNNTWECETESIKNIIDALPKNFNKKIDNYKYIYQKAMTMCTDSYKQIFQIIDEKNQNTKHYFPKFFDNFIKFDLHEYTDNQTIHKFLKNIINKTYNKNKIVPDEISKYTFVPDIIKELKNKKFIA